MKPKPGYVPQPIIVQFFHPGRECPVGRIPDGESISVSWNGGGCGKQQKPIQGNRTSKCKNICGSHTRRLIFHDGTFIDGNGKQQTARLAFWGEWEARTTAAAMPSAKGAGLFARWVHVVESPFEGAGKQATNTDPCVFGSTFKYCCCQQHRKGEKNPGLMRRLPPGSIVLFGSNLSGKFALDTVFVVGEKGVPYEATGDYSSLSVSQEYLEIALNRLRDRETNTFYRGVSFRRSGGMYSFAPARLFKEGDFKCGERFVLDFRKVNDCLRSSNAFAVKQGQTQGIHPIEAEQEVVRAVWTEIVRQVREAKFLPAVHFDWPK
ncbi:MAG: hypothetical protein IJ678_04795 [Kiritimatiellae bacterium]|nr:hypothetical protein [Kiritimatiellia bacterium]